MKWIYLIFIAYLFSFNVYADLSSIPKIILFHINGVNTTREQALENQNALKESAKISSNIIIWDILYNSTHGNLALDLLDVFHQKRQEGKDLTIDDYVLVFMKAYNLNYAKGSKEYNELKDNIKEHYRGDPSFVGTNLYEIIDQFHDKLPPPYIAIVELLNSYTAKGKTPYVLLMPHSQGNLYANQLWDYLVNGDHFPRNHLAILGFASPTDHMNGDGTYLTATNDYVISSLSIFSTFVPKTNKPLSGNIKIECKDMLCHSLIDAYLYDKESRSKYGQEINRHVLNLFNILENEESGKSINYIHVGLSRDDKILNSKGKVICDSHCDEKFFGYLDGDYIYKKNYDLIGNLPEGIYYYVYAYPFNYINFIDEIRGNFKSVIELYYTDFEDGVCRFYTSREIIKSNGFQSLRPSPQYICDNLPPEVFINGYQIIAKFILAGQK